MNKKLLLVVIILIPLTIISFSHKETNFLVEEKPDKTLYIKVKKDNKYLKLELEDYIIGVVAGEMPASFEIEALKAQAIASRTYAIKVTNLKKTIGSTTNDQVYITKEEMQKKWKNNYDKYYEKIKEAVTNTKNKIMYYNNEPIKSYYYSSSNGYTESSLNVFNEQNDYLNILSSPEEVNTTTITINRQLFCKKLSINCNTIDISNIIKDKSNRVSKITINNKTFKGTEIRKKLSLRSTDFEIKIEDEKITISTKGYGHGVGMSQYGANTLAKKGYTYEEILKYYYQNIEIDSI